jgi:protocatechuate 3,4-dioxygenase beta subunit
MNKKPILTGLLAVAVGAIAFAAPLSSGPSVGDAVNPFNPTHVTGPDKGTKTCPVCKYGAVPAVQVWVNGDSIKNIEPIAKVLNDRAASGNFKAFVVFLIDAKNSDAFSKKLTEVAQKHNLNSVSLTWLDKSSASVSQYKVNTDSKVKNTVLVYKDRKVTSKFVNLEANKNGMKELNAAVAEVTK